MSQASVLHSPCYCTTIRKATRAVTKFYDAILEPSGLRITQYALLNHLRRLGPVSLQNLSAAIRLERTTLLRNLDPLVKQGFARMIPGKPANLHLAELTEKGERLLQDTRPLWGEAQARLETIFTSEEQTQLRDFLQRLEKLTV